MVTGKGFSGLLYVKHRGDADAFKLVLIFSFYIHDLFIGFRRLAKPELALHMDTTWQQCPLSFLQTVNTVMSLCKATSGFLEFVTPKLYSVVNVNYCFDLESLWFIFMMKDLARRFQHGLAMLSIPVDSFIGRTDNSNGCHLVMGELQGRITRCYYRPQRLSTAEKTGLQLPPVPVD